jgi:hypothetical protein
MAKRTTQRSRHLLVWLHVVTSVGWMSQALAIFTLLVFGISADDPGTRLSAFSMAEVLDEHVLAYLANASALTGIMLAALTPWGFFRYWWVLGKFAITISQLYTGIFILSPRLAEAVRTAGAADGPEGMLAVSSLLMVSAIAFQAWLSIEKPWQRTPWTPAAAAARPPSGSQAMFIFATCVPFIDYALGAHVLGFPFAGVSLVTAIAYPIVRSRRLRRGVRESSRRLPIGAHSPPPAHSPAVIGLRHRPPRRA